MRKYSFFGGYKSLALILFFIMFVWVYIFNQSIVQSAIAFMYIYVALTIYYYIYEKIRKKSVKFNTFSVWLGVFMMLAALFFPTPVSGNLFTIGIIWILLFKVIGIDKLRMYLGKIISFVKYEIHNKSISYHQRDIEQKLRSKTNKNDEKERIQKLKDIGNLSKQLVNLVGAIAVFCLGVIIYFLTKEQIPKQSNQNIYWALAISVSLVSIIFIWTRNSEKITNIGILLAFFGVMFFVLGINYSSRIKRANDNFREAKNLFNTSYNIMKAGKEVDDIGDEIENNPLMQEAIEDGIIDKDTFEKNDDDELNTEMIHDLGLCPYNWCKF